MNDAPSESSLARSEWANGSAMMRDYYDHEWGIPVVSEAGLYERLCLEGFQAGLSWATILARREAFREAFADFDPDVVARFTDDDVERLVGNAAIIRSGPKIRSAISNARATIALRDHTEPVLAGWTLPLQNGETLDIEPGLPSLIWSFAPTSTPAPEAASDVPTQSSESVALCKELKRRGFSFVGPTTAYALMEAVGMVDTHWVGSHQRGVSQIFSPEGRRTELVSHASHGTETTAN